MRWLRNYWDDDPVHVVKVVLVLAAAVGTMALAYATLTQPTEYDTVASAPPTATATPTALVTTAALSAPSPRPVPVLELGQTQLGTNADTTLLQFRKVSAPADRAPAEGMQWLGIRARTCAHPDAEATGRLGWTAWSVLDSDGDRLKGAEPSWTDFPAQQFVTDGIEPGTCVVGWALVEAPKGPISQFEQAVFLKASMNPQIWHL